MAHVVRTFLIVAAAVAAGLAADNAGCSVLQPLPQPSWKRFIFLGWPPFTLDENHPASAGRPVWP